MAEFTKEQLIEKLERRLAVTTHYPDVEEAQLDAQIFKIALAALTAEPEVWEIENPGEGTFYSAHPPRDFEKAACAYYRLPLLEGLK